MALWKDTNTTSPAPAGTPPQQAAAREALREPERANVAALTPDAARRAKERTEPLKESVIASGVTIEGKIEGTGHVRIGGRFKGDVKVDGDLTIDSGANVVGQVRAHVIVVAGELQGNIEGARRVELAETGVITGDVKAGALTVAAGSRMRGQVEFGWDDKPAVKPNGETRGLGTPQ
jgi:cytoskeletal protein CcmA (bactofilin family)